MQKHYYWFNIEHLILRKIALLFTDAFLSKYKHYGLDLEIIVIKLLILEQSWIQPNKPWIQSYNSKSMMKD